MFVLNKNRRMEKCKLYLNNIAVMIRVAATTA
jgi:hypothetical protein